MKDVSKELKERELYKEMSDIYRRNYQVQMCLNDRLRLIEINKQLGIMTTKEKLLSLIEQLESIINTIYYEDADGFEAKDKIVEKMIKIIEEELK